MSKLNKKIVHLSVVISAASARRLMCHTEYGERTCMTSKWFSSHHHRKKGHPGVRGWRHFLRRQHNNVIISWNCRWGRLYDGVGGLQNESNPEDGVTLQKQSVYKSHQVFIEYVRGIVGMFSEGKDSGIMLECVWSRFCGCLSFLEFSEINWSLCV